MDIATTIQALLASPPPVPEEHPRRSASVALIWPQATGLIAGRIGLFTVAYVAFQRQEARA